MYLLITNYLDFSAIPYSFLHSNLRWNSSSVSESLNWNSESFERALAAAFAEFSSIAFRFDHSTIEMAPQRDGAVCRLHFMQLLYKPPEFYRCRLSIPSDSSANWGCAGDFCRAFINDKKVSANCILCGDCHAVSCCIRTFACTLP